MNRWRSNLSVYACLVFALAASPDAMASNPQLQYDPGTGELQIIDPDPAVAQVVLVGGPFQPGQFQQPPSTSVLLANSTNLSILFLHPQPAGPVSFGSFLPAGLNEQQFEDRFTAATSQGSPMTLVYVPEPASLSLVALGGLALFRRRRAVV